MKDQGQVTIPRPAFTRQRPILGWGVDRRAAPNCFCSAFRLSPTLKIGRSGALLSCLDNGRTRYPLLTSNPAIERLN